jgi:hypothetical protein
MDDMRFIFGPKKIGMGVSIRSRSTPRGVSRVLTYPLLIVFGRSFFREEKSTTVGAGRLLSSDNTN